MIDENPEAWKYGPVIPSLYHRYKHYKNQEIRPVGPPRRFDDNELNKYLDFIWEKYGDLTGLQLSDKTHEIDTPWFKTWVKLKKGKYHSLQIPETDIRDYYKAKYLLA